MDFSPHRGVARSRQEIFFTPCRGYTILTKFYGSTVHPSKADEGFLLQRLLELAHPAKIEQRTHGKSVQIGS